MISNAPTIAGIRLRRPLPPTLLRSPVTHAAAGFVVAWLVADAEVFPWLVLGSVLVAGGILAARWPLPAVVGAIALVPFLQLFQSLLWWHRIVPSETAERLGYVKEIVLVVAFTRLWPRRPQPLPLVEKLAFTLLGLVALYALAPYGPPLEVRYIAARSAVGFIVVFLIARWSAVSEALQRRIESVLMIGATVLAVLGIWNRWGPEGWSRWVDGTGVLWFRRVVLDAPTLGAVERVDFGDGQVIRAGSLFFTANDLAYFLLVIVAMIAGRLIRRVGRPWEPLVAGVCLLCIFYTFSRSAMALVGLVGLLVAAAAGRLSRGAGAFVAFAVAFVVLASLLGAGDQIASGADTQDERTAGHIEALGDGIERVVSHPLGSGLGTASATAIRFGIEEGVQTEDFYLRVGVEVGLLGTLLMVVFVVTVLRALWRRARQMGGGPAVGAFAALGAVATGALVLETFSELATGWTLWLLVGMSLPAAVSKPVPDQQPDVAALNVRASPAARRTR